MQIAKRRWQGVLGVTAILLAGGILALAGCGQESAAPAAPEMPREVVRLELVQSIPLEAGKVAAPVGRLDHLVYDGADERLFLAAVAEGRLEVVDLKAGKCLQAVAGIEEAQGVAFDPAQGWVYVSSGGAGTVAAYDARTLEKKLAVAVGADADNLRFTARNGKVWVGCGAGAQGAVKLLNATTLATEQAIALPAHPEALQSEPDGTRVYINVPAAGSGEEGVVVAAQSDTGAAEHWRVPGAGGNFPMALDAAHHRLYIAGRRQDQLVAVDTATGKVLATTRCVGDCDDIFIEAERGLILVIGGGARGTAAAGGAIEVYRHTAENGLTRVAAEAVPSLTRTGLWVPERRRLYVAVPGQPGRVAEIREYRLVEPPAATSADAAGGR